MVGAEVMDIQNLQIANPLADFCRITIGNRSDVHATVAETFIGHQRGPKVPCPNQQDATAASHPQDPCDGVVQGFNSVALSGPATLPQGSDVLACQRIGTAQGFGQLCRGNVGNLPCLQGFQEA